MGAPAVSVDEADFNHDGISDLVTADSTANTVSVMLGLGQGRFGAATHFAVGANPIRVIGVDRNRDGKFDIVAVNQDDNSISILLGNGDGTVHVHASVLESYVGKYQFDGLQNRIFTITREGDKLFVQQNVPHSMNSELSAESQTTFFLKTRPYKFIFTKAAGQPAQLDITQDTYVFHSKRVP